MFKFKILIIVVLIGSVNCSTLLTRKDYSASVKAHNEWDIQGAIKYFPKGEKGSFITTMEKTYLKLLSGDSDIDALIAYSSSIDNQIRYKASREIKSLFYQETPEGYYASEHEIIWMHLLLSWGFSMRGRFENAYTEAKICSNLLSNNWSEEGRFDDPFIRVMLASMWAMCGEWEEAQVDFRAAYRLDNSFKWANQLADRKSAPANLIIILGGTGPQPEWNPDIEKNPFRGFRGIKFNGQGVKSKLIRLFRLYGESRHDIQPT
ncbi:MAG: hypothetical protein JW864_05455 [Spirochaetes bacterium]|nr:hypothetical protein [Spirochaetota bacterium]